jgi:WD40 repeat protein
MSVVASGDDLYVSSWDRKIIQYQISTGETVRTFIGHADAVRRIVVVGDFIFSASSDGSARMWSRIRAVEIRRYLFFDDRIIELISSRSPFYFIMFANMINLVSNESKYIENNLILDQKIFGAVSHNGFLFVATRNYTTASVFNISAHDLNQNSVNTFQVSETFTSFFADTGNGQFIFATDGGTIISYDILTSSYKLEVFSFLV